MLSWHFFFGGTTTNVTRLIGLVLALCVCLWAVAVVVESFRNKRKGVSMLRTIAGELEQVVAEALPKLLVISEEESRMPTAPDKWSKKEVIGHLVDSAANNHQRFVRAQHSAEIRLGGYEQVRWVQSQAYQKEPWGNLVELWKSYNNHLAHVIAHIPADRLATTCFIGESDPVTLEFLVRDYLRHVKHHLWQILGGR